MTVESFDSFEDAQAAIEARVQAALEMIHDFQRPLQDGSKRYFVKLHAFGPGDVLLIAGWTYDVVEHSAMLAAKYPEDVPSASQQELEMRENLARGFALCQAFSAWEPDGETGDGHVATMLEITEAQYEVLREEGYDLARCLGRPEVRPVIDQWVKQVHYQ